jgi:sugar lactone lactonase YvrE
MPGSKGVVLLLLATLLTLIGKGWGRNHTSQTQSESSHLVSVRTYAPEDFRQPLLDRLSGGLPQRIPYRIAMDSQRRILVTDPPLSVVHVFDTKQWKRWQIRGDPQHRPVAPAYIAVDGDDNIYVTDLGLLTILVFYPNGRFKQTIGSQALNVPTGICVDKATRTVYVADWWMGEILGFDLDGHLLRVFGGRGGGPGQLKDPGDIVIHGDTLYVLDTGNFRFELFDLQGNFRGVWPFGADRKPIAFAFDVQGNLFYVDVDSGGLVAISPQGKVLGSLGKVRGYGQPWRSGVGFQSVAVDDLGEILVLGEQFNIQAVKLADSASGGAP